MRGMAGEQTFSTELWSLGIVADAAIFVDNNMAYVVTAGRVEEGENEREIKIKFKVWAGRGASHASHNGNVELYSIKCL